MFWRFGLNHSAIDALLDKEDLTLEDLLDEEDLLQECKGHNNKLIEYLRDPVRLSQLLNYITRDDLDERQRFKYPYVACEVLSCEIWAICEAVIDNIDLLNSFWQLLDRPPPLNPLQASYFTKVNVVFMQKKMSEMVKFIQSIPNVVKKMLSHMDTSAIMDLMLKLISVEEYPEGAGVIDWLNSEGLVEELISRLDPNLDPDVHSTAAQVLTDIIAISQSTNPEQGGVGPNALSRALISEKIVTRLVDYMLHPVAPNSTSSLTNGVSIFIQIIQKNNSDYNEEAMLSLASQQQQQQQHHSVVDLSDMLRVLANRIGEFKALLEKPKSVSGQIETTIGKMVPLGFERFRICELFAELLHCSNMSLLNTIRHETSNTTTTNGFFELKHDFNDYGQASNSSVPDANYQTQKVDESQTDMDIQGIENSKQKDSQEEESTTEQITKPVSSPILMDIVEETPSSSSPRLEYNTQTDNFNGSVSSELPVGDVLKSKFVEHKIMPTCLDLFFNFKWNNFLHTVVYDMIAQIFNGRMDIGYNKALAISVFTDGRLTKRITMAQRLNDSEVELPKGVRLGYMGHLTFIAEEVVKLLDRYAVEIGEKVREYIEAEDWQEYVSKTLRETRDRDRAALGGSRPSNHDGMSPSREESDDDDDDDDTIEAVDGGDMASDQFARYLCQQITNDLPDKFGSSDESDDDDEGWMGDEFDRDDFEMRGNFPNTNMLENDPFENRRSSLGLDEEFGESDEEDNPSQWPSNSQEHKQLLTVADWTADFQSGFKTSTQTSDATPSTAIVTTITTQSTNEVSTENSPTNPKSPITNVQEINNSVNNIKDEYENDLNLVTAQSNTISVIDNSHTQESTDTVTLSKLTGDEEGKHTNFATSDKMSVNVDSSDDIQNDVQKPNEKIQENDMKTI
ncbi:SIT4 phosphatase-associated protein [Glomus cerebriforme]|uniref:SIT4 phosphatase-associated protein n=1 Tax=Glomus cerebriforme TaxID=658196 RepID=A0A397SZM3_9GLOM|nr:SIT4 phosphatase-associated protein [Glomus cerebriforme]